MRRRAIVIAACLLVTVPWVTALAACSSTTATDTPPATATQAPAPPAVFGGPTTDGGSRYASPSDPIGGVVVETPPTAGTYTSEGWPVGSTSIARPAGTPSSPGAPSSPGPPLASGDLPPPERSPAPPAPPLPR